METAHEIVVRPTEVDVNGHVNNAKYVEHMEWGREERYERQGLAYARLLVLGAVTVTVNLKSKGAESRCSMTHYQLARRLARPRVGQDQRGIGLRPYRALEIKQSVSTGFDLALGAPDTGAWKILHGRATESSSAFVYLTQADGCQPASAQSSPLTAELQIMK